MFRILHFESWKRVWVFSVRIEVSLTLHEGILMFVGRLLGTWSCFYCSGGILMELLRSSFFLSCFLDRRPGLSIGATDRVNTS